MASSFEYLPIFNRWKLKEIKRVVLKSSLRKLCIVLFVLIFLSEIAVATDLKASRFEKLRGFVAKHKYSILVGVNAAAFLGLAWYLNSKPKTVDASTQDGGPLYLDGSMQTESFSEEPVEYLVFSKKGFGMGFEVQKMGFKDKEAFDELGEVKTVKVCFTEKS